MSTRRQRDEKSEPGTTGPPQPKTSDLRSAWMVVGGAGNMDRLKHRLVPAEPPAPLEVTVAVRAIGANFADIFTLLNLYSATPKGDFIPGLEFSGVIASVGSAVAKKWKVGTRVFGCTRFGAFTTRLNIDPRYIRKLPRSWSFNEGAALLAQALTAFYGLTVLGNMRAGHTVLVHSAAGGTGLWAVRFAQRTGALPIATIGTSAKFSALTQGPMCVLAQPLQRGAVIDRSACEGTPAVALSRALATYDRKTVDVVFDSLQGEWFNAAYNALEPMGRHVVVGAASMTPSGASPGWLRLAWQWLRRPMVDPLEMVSLNRGVLGFNLIWLYDRHEEMTRVLDDMLVCLGWDVEANDPGEPTDKPVIGATFSFSELPCALRRFQSGHTIGKVVIELDAAAIQPGAEV